MFAVRHCPSSLVVALVVCSAIGSEALARSLNRRDLVRLVRAQEQAVQTIRAEVTVVDSWNETLRGTNAVRAGSFAELLSRSGQTRVGTWLRSEDMVLLDLSGDGHPRVIQAWNGGFGTRIVYETEHAFIMSEQPLESKPRPEFLLGRVVDESLSDYLESADTVTIESSGEGVTVHAISSPYDVVIQWTSGLREISRIDVRAASAPSRTLETYEFDRHRPLDSGVVIPLRVLITLYRVLGADCVWYQKTTIHATDLRVNEPIESGCFSPQPPDQFVVMDMRTLLIKNRERIVELTRKHAERSSLIRAEKRRTEEVERRPAKTRRGTKPHIDSDMDWRLLVGLLLVALGVPIWLIGGRRTKRSR